MPPPMGSMPPPPGMLFPPGMPPVPAAGAHTLPPTEEIWVENKTPEGKVENGLLLKEKIDPFECYIVFVHLLVISCFHVYWSYCRSRR